ncbi:medium-chain acyl-CoA ligase ACSF2, mitochondrial-like [Octopus vulgaris]|uniref:Medium-chain acyl-CoA ligase ACSF2, mitochondrial n=1 Tax=Octopus vulgaris TaxID=6645 RepID=A0AA36FBZ4_OCTVU|nr:medium-chain acyl-CoA ligase ACSF2, mitochondrial-like [Octopus vulgaris]
MLRARIPAKVWNRKTSHIRNGLFIYSKHTGLDSRRNCTTDTKPLSSSGKKTLTHSYVHGPSDIPFLGSTIGNMFQEQTENNPDDEACVFYSSGIRRTFAQFLKECDQLAASFLDLGINKGDRIGIWGPNSYEWLLAQYAGFRAGIISVNVNPAFRMAELEHVVNTVGMKAIVMAGPFRDTNYYNILHQLIPDLLTSTPGDIKSKRLPSLKTIISMETKKIAGTFSFQEVLQAGTTKGVQYIRDLQKELQFDDPINIQFTSGTTGKPKGATLSHFSILNNSHSVGFRLRYNEMKHRVCMPVPLYHCFGSVVGALTMITHGTCCIFPSPGFEAKTVLTVVENERCNSMYGVPTMFIDILSHPDFPKYDLTSLRTGVMAGSVCPISLMERVMRDMHMPHITICYGSTETSPVTFQSDYNDTAERKCSTVGQVSSHTEAKIVNLDGKLLPVNEPGELYTRGYTTMLGYWNEAQKTSEVIKSGGWYATGDIGVLDENGYCKITGRIKDMIIRGGENIYPSEIETLLYKHPKVKDVQVVGLPDPRMGEEVCASIQLKEGVECSEDEIKDYCVEHLAKFKRPRYVDFVNSHPMTVTGKIQKFKIKENLLAKLNLK